jgi:ketosteroid isomerase-like protein
MTAGEDERALRALALAYAHHVDRREAERVAALFEPDAVLRMVWRDGQAPAAVSRGHRQIAHVVKGLAAMVATFHFVGNHLLEVRGDEATGEVYCQAHHLTAEGVDHVLYLRYLDRYRRSEAGWRFTERETVVEWSEQRAVARPQGVSTAPNT